MSEPGFGHKLTHTRPKEEIPMFVSPEELHLYGDLLDDLHVVPAPVEPGELRSAIEDAVPAQGSLSTAG